MATETLLIICIISSIASLLIGIVIGWVLNNRNQDTKNINLKTQLEESLTENHELNNIIDGLNNERSILKEDIASIKSTLDAKTQETQTFKTERDEARKIIDDLKDSNSKLNADIQSQNAEFEERQKSFNEKIVLLENAEKQLTQNFENIANKIFENKSDIFKKTSSEQIKQLLTPFREQIDGLHRDVKEASKERHTLGKEIEKIVTETNSLTKALKGDSKQQGNWGELVLETILDNSGLRKGKEYDVQSSFTAEDGSRLRPDVIIHLPEKRDIIIDSKVSLKDYEKYVNTESEEDKKTHLQAHIQSIRQHINILASKNYEYIPDLYTLDYTLMWIPIEPAYFTAVQADNDLITMAMSKRVLLVSATSLFSVLKVIEKIWQYENQNNNVNDIISRANSLYDKFVGFIESMNEIGTRIGQAQNSFDTAKNRLTTGPGNVIRQVEMLREMGLNPKKKLPDDVVQMSGALIEKNELSEDD